MAGVDLPTVQKISGHKTKEMIFRYAHQDKKHIDAALDALDQRIMPDTITPKLHNIRT